MSVIDWNQGMASASASAPDHLGNTDYLHKSQFQQTVCLVDWWLVKADNDVPGRRLAVAGLTDRGKQAMRVFISAPILKRYDVCTVETSDGICVQLDGFINKARTLENGFPSDVFNHFIFGFPPYYKEYDEKLVTKVPSSKDMSSDDLLEKRCRPLGSTGSAQLHVDSHEKCSGSEEKTDANVRQKSKKSNSFAVPLPNRCSEHSLQKESYSGGTASVEDHTATYLPVNEVKNEMKSLSDLNGGGIRVQSVIDKHVDHFQILGNGGTLFACRLNKKRTQKAADNLMKVDRNKKTRTNLDWDASSSERFLTCNEVRVKTCLISGLKLKPTNNKKSAEISDGEKIRLNSTSSIDSGKVELDLTSKRESGSRNYWNSVVNGLRTDKIEPRLSDADSIILRESKTKSKISKVKSKAMELPCTPAASMKSHRTSASEDNKRDSLSTAKYSLSERTNASDVKTSQKLAPVSKETPKTKKEKVQSVSSESFSFKRSRSGRLLMPTLEFWRNQRAVYNADRTITGIDEGIHPTA